MAATVRKGEEAGNAGREAAAGRSEGLKRRAEGSGLCSICREKLLEGFK